MRQTWLLCGSLPFGSEPQSLQVAVSPCWNQALPGVISANLSSDAWTPTTVVAKVHIPVSSLDTSAFPKVPSGRLPTTLRSTTSEREGAFAAAVIH